MFTLSEYMKIVEAIALQVGGAITGNYVSLKNAHMVDVVVHITQGNAATVAITIEQATAVAPTGSKAITVAVPIWANQDCATSDLLVRQTDAVSFTTSTAVKHKIIKFQIDPATLDQANNFDCITVKTASSHADNLTQAIYYLHERYAADQPPSAIID